MHSSMPPHPAPHPHHTRRIAPGHGCQTAGSSGSGSPSNLAAALADRERAGRAPQAAPLHCPSWHVESAILKLHARRVCCLEFHPTNDDIVVSGDKRGQVAVWNYQQVGAGSAAGNAADSAACRPGHRVWGRHVLGEGAVPARDVLSAFQPCANGT
jgi:DNA damage-binding protein 2